MPARPRKTPMRMCVGCREMKPKMELIKVVKPKEGDAHIDRVGKAPGRGAYVCPNIECLKKAQKTRALERALDAKIEESVFQALEADILGGGEA